MKNNEEINKEKLQNLLKSNLKNEIVRLLENDKQNFLYILDHKKEIIINTINVTYEMIGIKDNLIVDDVILNDDYNYLDDAFFSIYTKIKDEILEKQKLFSDDRVTKLVKMITNYMEYTLDEASKQGVSKSQGVLTFKMDEARNVIFKDINEHFEEKNYSMDEMNEAYNKALEKMLALYGSLNDNEVSPIDQEEDVKLHWVWKANIVLDSIRTFFDHF